MVSIDGEISGEMIRCPSVDALTFWKDRTLLTFDQIKELIELVAGHQMTGIEVERSGFRLKIDGYKTAETVHVTQAAEAAPMIAAPVALPAPSAPPAAPAPAAEAAPSDTGKDGEPPEGSQVMTSPIVGTFYRSPNPEAPAFVSEGDRVKKGQVLCIVEAMKLMNEIEADVDGEIVAVYPENAQPVEFGERLFAIKPV